MAFNISLSQLGDYPEYNELNSDIRDIISNPTQYIGKEICGPNQYVSLPQVNPQTGQFEEGCVQCDTLTTALASPLNTYLPNGQTPAINSINPTPGDPNISDRDSGIWNSLRPPVELARMCHPSPNIYVPAQYDANPYKSHRNLDWRSIVPINNNQDKDLYLKWFSERLDDSQLMNLFNYHQRSNDLPAEITNLDQFKQKISEGRGSIVPCTASPSSSNSVQFTGNETSLLAQATPGMCPTGNFGPNNIIYEEYNDWKHKNDYTNQLSVSNFDTNDFSMFSSNFSMNNNFESCMNNILGSTSLRSEDLQQISEIHSRTHFRELTDSNIMFIQRKMSLFMINSNQEAVVQCMKDDLYNDVSICDASLPEQILKLVQIVIYIVGYDFRNNKIESESDKQKLMNIIDQLGPLLPKVLKSIIDISEKYESQYCAGHNNQSTVLLKELYEKVFQKNHSSISLGNPFSELISDETSSSEFNRSTILMILGIAFLKYF